MTSDIYSLEDFEKVVDKMQKALEDGLLSIENARTKDHFIISQPLISFRTMTDTFHEDISIYRGTFKRVYSGDRSIEYGMKVYANEEEK